MNTGAAVRQLALTYRNREPRFEDVLPSAWASAFLRLIEQRDPALARHSRRVAFFAWHLGQLLDPLENRSAWNEQLRLLANACLVHDLGKLAWPDKVLFGTGILSDDEVALIEEHPESGYQVLTAAGHDFAARVARYHHEWWDGTGGYPGLLSGSEIPLPARIVAIADCFEAYTAQRPYHLPITAEDALREIAAAAGTQFDPQLVDLFLKLPESVLHA